MLSIRLDPADPKTMSTAAQASPNPNKSSTSDKAASHSMVLVPYLVAIAAQGAMLFLYFSGLTAQPHYQPWIIAVIATIGIAVMRWPTNLEAPFRKSTAASVLIVLSILSAVIATLFVEPWFAALSMVLLVTSLFARTTDKETLGSLWPCSLPLYVYLTLPNGMDTRLITNLQYYSAIYTSRLLDLAGLGHHMDGTVINVPDLKEYGIEEACSGVQSFFTLLLVAVVYIVLTRRNRTPQLGVSILSLVGALMLAVIRMIPGVEGLVDTVLILLSVGLGIFAFIGFRAAVLILSAVFWAVFMNTIRILTIPLAEYFFKLPLSDGIGHTFLGYISLAVGILMLLSTDQFLLFLFGPVEESNDSGPFGRLLSRMWNGLSSSDSAESEPGRRSRKIGIAALSGTQQKFLWVSAGLIAVMGLWQTVDVYRSWNRAVGVRFFDADVTVDFGQNDMPAEIKTWKRVKYEMQDRSRGSDLGERSDVWQFRSPQGVSAVASIDQPFPGWHELTTCYTNTGWKLVGRRAFKPADAMSSDDSSNGGIDPSSIPGDPEWGLVEAIFEKPTGERGYLLFSHFDSFGEGLDVPSQFQGLTAFLTRAANRLSHRIRATLLRGEAYQVQVFLTSYDDFDPVLKDEVRERYLKIREEIRQRFLEKQKTGNPSAA